MIIQYFSEFFDVLTLQTYFTTHFNNFSWVNADLGLKMVPRYNVITERSDHYENLHGSPQSISERSDELRSDTHSVQH